MIMKKIISKILLALLLFAAAAPAMPDARAAEVEAGGARAIYVVFDNSGSMYGPGNMRSDDEL